MAPVDRHGAEQAGDLVVPGFVNLHLHADKALLGEVMRPNASGTLPEAIEITNDFKRKYDPQEVARRAGRVIETGIRNGTSFFRLFADVGTIGGLRAAQGLLLVREKYARLCDIQVVAFPQEGIVRDPGAAELLDEALKQGCDVVGGLPWYEYTDDKLGIREAERRELSQSRISRLEDNARRISRPGDGQSLRRDGGIQRRLCREDHRYGRDRERHHLRQHPHQSRLLGAA